MVKTAHQPYEYPVIAEALCEVHFQRDDSAWNKDWLDVFAETVKDIYPTKEVRHLRQIKAEVGPQGVSVQPEGDAIPRYILKHTSRPHLLQLSPFLFTVNELPKYPGWKQFATDLEAGWAVVNKISTPSKIRRIGLRYINRISRKDKTEKLAEWLSSSAYYPSKFLESNSQFSSRMEMRVDSAHRVVVSVAEGAAEAGKTSPIILDIDSIFEGSIPAQWGEIKTIIDDLHERVWDVFHTSASEKLKKLMKGDQK